MESTATPKVSKKPRAHLTFTDGLWHVFARTHHLVSKIRQKELRQYGMTMNEAVVLLTILRLKGSATPTAIASELFWELHTVSEQLKSMEAKGLIRKVRDLGRRNLIRAEATDKGVEAYRRSARWRSTRETMSALTEEEQLQLWAILSKLRAKALQQLNLTGVDPYPPADPSEL